MKILACHNYYRSTSGEDLVFAEEMQILKGNGVTVQEYRRENSSIDGLNIIEKARLVPQTIYSFRTVREITQIIHANRPDIALVQNVLPLVSPSIYQVLYRLNVPIVQLVYNYRLICPNAILYTEGAICERCVPGNYSHAIVHKCYRDSWFSSALYATTLSLQRHLGRVARTISAYVTPDNFLKEKLVEGGYPGERMFPLLNPFDISKYSAHFNHNGSLVYFGRIVREKGIFTLLTAMRRLQGTRLIVIGGGEAEGKAKEMAREYGLANVEFVGPQYGDDLIDILREACAVVVPTEWYDNSPLVVHQAFALGKPVIASRIDGIPEIVTHESEGLLFEPGDSVDLEAKLRCILDDKLLRDRLGRQARAKAEQLFTPERRFEGLMNVFQFALNNPISR